MNIFIFTKSSSTLLQDRKSWLESQKLSVTGRTIQAQQVALEGQCTQEEIGFQVAKKNTF